MAEHPLDQLEPACLTDTSMLPSFRLAPEMMIAMSQAVSLKRIADIMESVISYTYDTPSIRTSG